MPNPSFPRDIDPSIADAIDVALANACGVSPDQIMHAIRPPDERMNASSIGVLACVPMARPAQHHLILSYGMSHPLDQGAAACAQCELAICVPSVGSFPPAWAALLLHHLAQYQTSTLRGFQAGDHLRMYRPLPCIADPSCPPETWTSCRLSGLLLVADPLLGTIHTPRARVDVLRVVGLDDDELDWIEAWSAQGVTDLIMQIAPELSTDPRRDSMTCDDHCRQIVADGIARQGSATSVMALDGLRWDIADADTAVVRIPAGRKEQHLGRVLQARLGHGMGVVVQDIAPGWGSTIAFEPGDEFAAAVREDTLVIRMSAADPRIAELLRGSPIVEWAVYLA